MTLEEIEKKCRAQSKRSIEEESERMVSIIQQITATGVRVVLPTQTEDGKLITHEVKQLDNERML